MGQVLWGQGTLRQQLGGLSFDISAGAFFQTNTAQAAALQRIVSEAAGERSAHSSRRYVLYGNSAPLNLRQMGYRSAVGCCNRPRVPGDGARNKQDLQIVALQNEFLYPMAILLLPCKKKQPDLQQTNTEQLLMLCTLAPHRDAVAASTVFTIPTVLQLHGYRMSSFWALAELRCGEGVC